MPTFAPYFWKDLRTCDRGWHIWLYVGPKLPQYPETCLTQEISHTCRRCGVKYQMTDWRDLRGCAAGPNEYIPYYTKSYINPRENYQI